MASFKTRVLPFVLLAVLSCVVTDATAATCESLAGLRLADTTITLAEAIEAGSFTPPRNGLRPIPIPFCRVTGTIKPTVDSDIKFELWLPKSGWTGRYESVGNGGFAGSIRYDSMVNPLLGGSAVASTDDGHTGAGASWALGHPEKIVDYGYRAVHLTAEISKAITTAFYESKPKYSYFVGCSKGGQEAFMEAQRYPDDFDGILAAAAANQWTNLFSSFAWAQKTNQAEQSNYVSAMDMERVGAAVQASCDASDGVKDGLISNPLACRISIEALGLDPARARTFQALHDGPKTSSDKQIYAGHPYGGELVGWRSSITGPGFEDARTRASQSTYANGFFANFVYQDANWDFRDFNIDKGPSDAEKALGNIMNSDKLDFASFKKHGGKLIQWHGWADVLVTPLGAVDFYSRTVMAEAAACGRKLLSSVRLDTAALNQTQEFYRLFLAPGVSHCGGGPGPNQLGQAGGNGDPEHDIVSALYDWVEKGIAPQKIIATKFVSDDPEKGIALTRPLCPYPQVAKYKGSGDTNNAANFACAAP